MRDDAPSFVTDARLADGRHVDLRLEGGRIAGIVPHAPASGPRADAAARGPGLDAAGRLVLPSPIEAHVHLDKTFLGCPWQPHLPGPSVADRIRLEKAARAKVTEPVAVRGGRLAGRLLERGAGRVRSHADVDPEWGLANVEGELAVREAFAGRLDVEIVAFPQSGILRCPGTAELLDEALAAGCDLVGGLDPAGIDGDPVAHLRVVFDLAAKHGKGVDVHLHDGGELGCFELRLVAERALALGLADRVTVSHAFALAEADDVTFGRTAETLAEAGISILSAAPPRSMPPVKRLLAAGVNVCAGSDNIRDAWSPHGNGDTLERATMAAHQQGWRDDADLALAFDLVGANAAKALGVEGYGLAVGAAADLLLIEAETLAEAVAQRPLGRTVLKAGRVVAGGGPPRGGMA